MIVNTLLSSVQNTPFKPRRSMSIVDNYPRGIGRVNIIHFTCRNAHKRLSQQKNPMLECRPHESPRPLRCLLDFPLPAPCRDAAQTTRPTKDLCDFRPSPSSSAAAC